MEVPGIWSSGSAVFPMFPNSTCWYRYLYPTSSLRLCRRPGRGAWLGRTHARDLRGGVPRVPFGLIGLKGHTLTFLDVAWPRQAIGQAERREASPRGS
eukprot:4651315-Pyramimonas_sp.AAC.1